MDAFAVVADLGRRAAEFQETFEPTPEESPWGHDPRACSSRTDAKLRRLEREELRAMRHERGLDEYEHGRLDVEGLEGDSHEGWAYDRLRDAQGKPYPQAEGPVPPLSARGHIERVTRGFRLRRAGQHADRSKRAKREASRLRRKAERTEDGSRRAELTARARAHDATSDWHRGRARGQRERFHELNRCGDGYAKISCRNCEPENLRTGAEKGRRTRQIGCSVNRACVRCRDHRANERRAVFWRARASVLHECAERQLFRRKRHGGRWGEKDFTLTLPDGLITGPRAVERRIKLLFSAWRHFSRMMAAHWRSEPRRRRDPALRQGMRPFFHAAFEITPGADGLGHPHWHVWLISPWLDQENIRRWWAKALRKEGLNVTADELIKPVLREVRCETIVNEVFKGKERIRLVAKDPKRVARETDRAEAEGKGRPHHVDYIEGWTMATKGKKGQPGMNANVQARVYMALEGKRTIRCTRGFLQRGYRPNACPACGADHVVLDFATGECVPALEATVVTWRSPWWEERGPPLARAGPHRSKPSPQEKAS